MKDKIKLLESIACLSSGTLATLTGLRLCGEIEAVHGRFAAWAQASDDSFGSWQDAWAAFVQSGGLAEALAAIEATQQDKGKEGESDMSEDKSKVTTKTSETTDAAEAKKPDALPEWVERFFRSLDLSRVKAEVQFKIEWARACEENGVNPAECNAKEFSHMHLPITPPLARVPVKKSIYDSIMIAASKDDTRRAICGFHITEDGKQIVATDGRRLIILPYDGNLRGGTYNIVNDHRSKQILSCYTYEQYLTKWKEARADENHPLRKYPYSWIFSSDEPFIYEDGRYMARSKEAYPNFRNIIPPKNTLLPAIDGVENLYGNIKAALQVAKIAGVADSKYPNTVHIRDRNGSLVAVNGKYFMDGIAALGYLRSPISLQFNADGTGPMLMATENGGLYALMPMQGCALSIVVNDLPIYAAGFVGGYAKGVQKPAKKTPKATAVVVTRHKAETSATGKQEVKTAAKSDVDEPIKPTDRVLKNLSFKQLMRFGKEVMIEARKDTVHRLFDAGKLAISEYVNKKGGKHYLTGKQFMGETAYRYARHLLEGGEKFDFSKVDA